MSKIKMLPFTSVLKDNTSKFTKIKKQDYLEKGTYKIIDQGQSFIAGFTNDSDCVNNFDGEVIIFGDHTRIFKFINFPIAIGADGVKVLEVINKDEFDIKFLYFYLKSVKLHNAGYSRHFKFLKEIKIPLLPLQNQQKIAQQLSQIEELINKREESIKLLDELTKSTFLDMFGDLNINKYNWKSVSFESIILDVKNGITRRGKQNKGDVVLKLKDIRINFIDYENVNRIELTQSEKDKFSVTENNLLFIRVNGNPDYVGRCAVFNGYSEPVYYNDHIMRIEVNNDFNSIFLAYLINSHYGKYEIKKYIKTSAGQYTINQEGLGKIKLFEIPKPLQDKFAEIVNQIEQTKTIYQNSLTELNNLFGSIAQKAFKGELDVSKIELIQKATQVVESQEAIVENKIDYVDTDNNPIFSKDFVKMLINQAGQLTNEKLMNIIKQYSFKDKVSFDDIKKSVIELIEHKDIEQIVITTENISGFDKEIGFKIRK